MYIKSLNTVCTIDDIFGIPLNIIHGYLAFFMNLKFPFRRQQSDWGLIFEMPLFMAWTGPYGQQVTKEHYDKIIVNRQTGHASPQIVFLLCKISAWKFLGRLSILHENKFLFNHFVIFEYH